MEISDAYTLVDRIFLYEPDAIVMICENKNPIAILYKDEWEDSDKFNHVKAKCRQYKAPALVERVDIPIIGVLIRIELHEIKED